MDLPARSFDLDRRGVAPPLLTLFIRKMSVITFKVSATMPHQSPRRSPRLYVELWSSVTALLVQPRTRTDLAGHKFSHSAPAVWNSLKQYSEALYWQFSSLGLKLAYFTWLMTAGLMTSPITSSLTTFEITTLSRWNTISYMPLPSP